MQNKDNFTDLVESFPQATQTPENSNSNQSGTEDWTQDTNHQVVGNEGEIITLGQER